MNKASPQAARELARVPTMFLKQLECTICQKPFDSGELATFCKECVAPLAARYDLESIRSTVDRDEITSRKGGMWRWSEVMPLPDPARAVDLGEGDTPLLELPRLAEALGVKELFAKDEGQNPTGSFKARGLGCGVSMAKHLGATALAAPSAGNAGGALAAYGARAGLPVHLALPRDVPSACRVEAEVLGAEITLIDGTIADCGKWIGERAAKHGWHDLSTLKEPYRVEGKKTMGYELAEQFGWSLPDVILYPTGGGTGLLGMAKAFDEMRALGWLAEDAPRPRFIAVQAAGCAPMVDAFRSGAERAVIPDSPHTCASGLRVPSPIGDRWMLSVLQECGGDAIAIDDDELVEATRELGRAEGIFAAPEGGALVAALRLALGDGRVRPDERCVLFLTGTGVKYLECFVDEGI